MKRRNFLKSIASLGGFSIGSGRLVYSQDSRDSLEELDRAASASVVDLKGLNTPVLIEAIDVVERHGEHFVRVRSRDGAQGISVTNDRIEYLRPILERLIIPYFVGKDARDIEQHLFGVYRHQSNYKLQGIALWCPVAWVEFAVLDLLGRVAGRSLGELLGGVLRNRIPYYVASGRRDSTPEQEVKYLQELLDETGARAVKFRVGGRMSRNADAIPGRTPALISLARKNLGDAIDIHADSNSSYDPPQAIEVGRMLEAIKAVYFEEPCPFDHLEDTKKVTDTLAIPVSGGEQEFSERRFRWMIHNRGVDIVQPDLQYYGGLIRSIRVANMAETRGMPTTVHISGGFGFIYMLHFASRTRSIGAYQEYKRGIEKYGKWFSPALTAVDGAFLVPQGAGVGIVDPRELLKD